MVQERSQRRRTIQSWCSFSPPPIPPSTGTDLSVTCSADMRHLNPGLSQPGALGTYAEVGEWEGRGANQWSKRDISSLSARLIQRNLSECREFHSTRPFQTSGALRCGTPHTHTKSSPHTSIRGRVPAPPCLVLVFFRCDRTPKTLHDCINGTHLPPLRVGNNERK